MRFSAIIFILLIIIIILLTIMVFRSETTPTIIKLIDIPAK